MKNIQPRYLLSGLALVSQLAIAAERDPSLPEITSVARRPQLLDEAKASVTLITRADIEAMQAQDAVQLLRQVAGIDLSRTGGPGSATSVLMRGSNSNHTLVLIDGVRMASANTGAYAFEQLPIEMIERIEIVRGPRAALYGSDAIGGMIYITTSTPTGVAAKVATGSFASRKSSAGFGVGDQQLQGGVSFSRDWSEGFSAQNTNGFSYDPDKDGQFATRVAAHIAGQPTAQFSFKGSALQSATDVEFDQGRSDLTDQTLGFTADHQISPTQSQQFRVGYAKQSLLTPVFFSDFQSKRWQADYQHDWSFTNDIDLSTGLQLQREQASGAGENGVRDKRRSSAVFARVAKAWDVQSVELSARADHYTGFGGHGSFGAAYGYQWAATRWFASVGQGFRAPNFNELFSPGFGGQFAGNPALDPERSQSIELGVSTDSNAALVAHANLFRTRIRDLISFSGGSNFRAVNTARAGIDGVEIGADWNPASICGWQANITLQQAQNRDTDTDLLRRARRKAQLSADCTLADAWQLRIDGFAYSARKDFAGTLPGYGLLDLGLRWQVAADWSLALKLENAFDKAYELAGGFNTPTRNWLLQIHFRQ
jgi:vitamin B12 transporter